MIKAWDGISTVVVGMLHAPALPGSPGYAGGFEAIESFVVNDAKALAAGGVHGLMLENFGDVPFFKDRVEPITVAAMTRLAMAVKRAVDLPLGINVLRNDALSALSIAAAVNADYIRVNVLTGAMVTDQGLIEGRAAELMRVRDRLSASGVKVLADVAVKHAAPLAARPLVEEVDELTKRAGADGVIVSGVGTGSPTPLNDVDCVKNASGDCTVWVGSGVDRYNASKLSEVADGLIVGSSLKIGGKLHAPVDTDRVRDLLGKF